MNAIQSIQKTVDLIRNSRFGVLLVGSFSLVLIILFAALFLPTNQSLPPILDRYGDIPLVVGSSSSNIEGRNIQIVSSTQVENTHFINTVVRSRKNANFENTVISENGTIIQVSHHVTLNENLKLDEAKALIESPQNATEYRDEDDAFSDALLIYPAEGIAVRFHPHVETVTKIYQFQKGNRGAETFLSNNPVFIPLAEIPDEEAEGETYADFFATLEDTEQATGSASPVPQNTAQPAQ